MRRILSIILFIFISTSLSAQEETSIGADFDALDVRGKVNVILESKQGLDENVGAILSVEGVPMKRVKWKIKNGVLNIEAELGILESVATIELRVYVTEIKSIVAKGATITSLGRISSKDLRIETLGTVNKMNIDLSVDNLEVKCAGDTDITLSGRADKASIECLSASRVDMIHCPVKNLYCKVNGWAELYADVSEIIEGKVSSASTLYYMGNPELAIKTKLMGAAVLVE